MTAILMKGKTVAEQIRVEISAITANQLPGIIPTLVVVIPAGEAESDYYLRSLVKTAGECDIRVMEKVMPADANTQDYLYSINSVDREENIHGILLLKPLPRHIDAEMVTNAISFEKDVDGVTIGNMAALYQERPMTVPATAASVLALLDCHHVELKGIRAVVLGRSLVVGKPTALLLLSRHATVTICHSRTVNLGSVLKECDVVVTAVGVAGLVKPEMIKPGAVVVDAGFNVLPDGSIMGDTDPTVVEVASLYAPVPGGVGPLTVTCLLRNLLSATLAQVK